MTTFHGGFLRARRTVAVIASAALAAGTVLAGATPAMAEGTGPAPIAESVEFPFDGTQGAPVGTTGTFTFSPRMENVVEYVYQFNRYQAEPSPERTVAAGPDGTATVTFTPTFASMNTLDVFSRTATGEESYAYGVAFYPRSIAPTVSSDVYPPGRPGGGPGIRGTFTFRPTAAGVVRYTYQLTNPDGATPTASVRAARDGSATITWRPKEYPDTWGGWFTLEVRSHSANGLVSDRAYYGFQINSLQPQITTDAPTHPDSAVVGETYTFTFTNVLDDARWFEYSFDDAEPVSLRVRRNGTATVRWTVPTAYGHSLVVRSRTKSGLISGWTFLHLWAEYPAT